jgi:pyruvate dehydrogenase E1 component beta subunit
MVLEALRAAECLSQVGVSVEVIDIRSLKPLDTETILESVKKTSHLIVADTSWKSVGFASEVVATVSERVFDALRKAPRRVALPDVPTPTTPALSGYYYPGAVEIVGVACDMLGVQHPDVSTQEGTRKVPYDVPDPSFMGPF